jgi:polysaccharide pyruvyl transferase WcaK-like protein
MTTLFCIRPTTRNIGNDLIHKATCDLIRSVFGHDAGLVSIPALKGGRHGGLTAAQVYDINRLADGVVIGGGNLLENGQLTFDPRAFAALHVPLMLMGISHGRIHDGRGNLVDRTDSLPPATVRALCERASVVLVRDRGTKHLLESFGVDRVELGGCPSLFVSTAPADDTTRQRILISIRHPSRMSVPAELQWRTVSDLRGLIAALKATFGEEPYLVCHDYSDLEFARGFSDTPCLYFDDANLHLEALRTARFTVTYRLHAFLPCLALGTPSIHLSYDERGREMVATAGMGEWDIDLIQEHDVVAAVMQRVRNLEGYRQLRSAAQATIRGLQATSDAALRRFAADVAARKSQGRGSR